MAEVQPKSWESEGVVPLGTGLTTNLEATHPRLGKSVYETLRVKQYCFRPIATSVISWFRLVVVVLAIWALLVAVAGQSAINGHAMAAGWELERDVETPSYAIIEPESTDLNIDSLVLSCEQGPLRRGLQLRLYPSGPGTLYPQDTGDLKADPTVEFAIDGASYVVQVLFADTFVVVADSADGVMPLLSRTLLDALQAGRRMELRLQLVQTARGQAPTLGGTAAFNLQAGLGGAAVAAVRRCAGAPDLQSANQPASR